MKFRISTVKVRGALPVVLFLFLISRVSGALPFPADLLSEQARLTNEISTDSAFGSAVAYSGDLVAVGARDYSSDSTVQVFERQGTNWQPQAVVLGVNTNLSTDFGRVVALDSDTLVVGTPNEDVQVFVRSGADWLPRGLLTSGPQAQFDHFGDSLAIAGDTITVGASGDDQFAANAGAAYVFERSAAPAINAWNITDDSEVAGGGGHRYGWDLSSDELSSAKTNGWRYMIKSRLVDDFNGTKSLHFRFDNGSTRFLVWLDFDAAGDLVAELPGAVPGTFVLTTNGFGSDAYHEHELVFDPSIGMASYFYDGNLVTTWAGLDQVESGVSWGAESTSGQGSMNFHEARFEIVNEGVVASYSAGQHPSVTSTPESQGWTLFSNNAAGLSDTGIYPDASTWWSPRLKLMASDADASDNFGSNLAIDGDTLVVGAARDDDGGSAYVFVRNGNNWTEQTKLTADDRQADDRFGSGLAIEADRVFVGAPSDDHDGLSDAGSVYLFERVDDVWTQATKLTLSDSAAGEQFGNVAAVHGETIVVGTANNDSGAVYIFVRDSGSWIEWGKRTYPQLDATVWSIDFDGHTIALGVANGDGADGTAYLVAPDFTSEVLVTNYVNKFLYYPNGTPGYFDKNNAAFRYKHLLYGTEGNLVRARVEDMPNLFGPADRQRADDAKSELLRAISANPSSEVFANLLLDIYYNLTVAEVILAKSVFPDAEVARLGPPSSPGGLIIDDEILSYETVVETNRLVLSEYFALLQDDLGQSGSLPLGYLIFQQQVPIRTLEPATFLDNDVHQPVVPNGVIVNGYKDLVLLFDFLRYQGRSAATLANLYIARKGPSDITEAESLIDEFLKSLALQGNILLGVFPELELVEGDGSGLAEAVAGWRQVLNDLSLAQQVIVDEGNLLGFNKDFLMLVQKFAGQSEDVFDSYDALQLRLDPGGSSNPLRLAKERLAQAKASFGNYRGYQDQLEDQLSQIRGEAEDRLFQLVGAYPGDNAYETPTENEGSELWQQAQSIKQAQLRVDRNQVEMSNLREEIEIEVSRSAHIYDVTIGYGVQNANLAQEIAFRQGAQDSLNTIAGAGFDPIALPLSIIVGVYGHFGTSKHVAVLEGDKEMLAAWESAEISEIESRAIVKTLMLGMRTLLVDSEEAVLLLKQEWGRYAALLREKENLERTLAESNNAFVGRYFADPVHQLRAQHETLIANLSFEEAQKWLFFMARALEYKWNTPFADHLYLGRLWSTDTLLKLRNAEELELFYNAMVDYENQIQLPKDDYFDWFSVRDDFFGYKRTNNLGQLLFYVDAESGESVDANEAFRRKLRSLQDDQGNILLDFSTVREVPGGTFFRGPRFDNDGQVISKGLFMDKIRWMKINLPGSHTYGRSQLTGELTYGGTSFIRNFDVGQFVPDRPDRLRDEMTAYSTRFWFFHAPSGAWRFSEALSSPVTMQVSADPRVPPTVQQLDVFKERSVATTGWKLNIPTRDLGQTVLDINELDDVELYFYHYAVTRP